MSSVRNNSLKRNNNEKKEKLFTEKQNKTTEKLENVGWGRKKKR